MTKKLSEDEFDAQFTFVPDPDTASYYWDGDQIQTKQGLTADHIWSAVDGDEGGTYLIPGVHFVNVFAFVVTKQSHDYADMEVCIKEPSPKCVCGMDKEEHENWPEDYDHEFTAMGDETSE